MAPKKLKAPATAKSKAAESTPDLLDNSHGNASAEHLIRVHEAIKDIMDEPVFKDVQKAAPLTYAQGGKQAAFDKKSAALALSQGGQKYAAAGNFFWMDVIWLANHRIPINSGQIREIQRFSLPALQPPSYFPFEVTVAVEDAAEEQLRPQYQRLSPAEPIHALLFSIQAAVKSKADQSVLQAWRRVLLTVPFSFEVVALGEPRFWRAQNLREEAVEHGLTVRLSTVQRIYDIAGFKAAKDSVAGANLGADKIAALYEKHLKQAKGAETINKTFVDIAITVHKRLLSLDSCRQILAACDVEFITDNPWKSIYALQALVDRASSAGLIQWSLEGLMDGWRMKFLDKSVFFVNKLRDSRNSVLAGLGFRV